MAKKCIGCGREVSSKYVEFDCPKCGGSEIIRCRSCRVLGSAYVCEKCGFRGP